MATGDGPLKTQAALAAFLGLSQQRVSTLVADAEWRWGAAPWTRERALEIRGWLAERRSGNNATAAELDDQAALRALARNPEKLARLKQIIARTSQINLEIQLKSGGYLKREQVEQERTQRVYAVRAKLQELPLRAHLIAQKSEAECERIIEGWMREICDFFAGEDPADEGDRP